MPLNNLQRIFYQNLAEKRLLGHEGQAFEDFFVEVGRLRWGEDFEPIRAYGKHGDLKCDGRRISTGTLYQCYGPRTANASAVHKKIHTDFYGARAIWGEKLKGWSIVTNDRLGLDALATIEVDGLRAQHPEIIIRTVLPIDVVKIALELPLDDLAQLFGLAITERDSILLQVSFSDLGAVIDELSGIDPPPSLDSIKPPPENKIAINSLGEEIAALLRKGDLLASHVDAYFNATGRVEVGERLSVMMKKHYLAMKGHGFDSTQIFHAMINLCGGLDRPKNQGVAVLALVTYYFHRCDIFENA